MQMLQMASDSYGSVGKATPRGAAAGSGLIPGGGSTNSVMMQRTGGGGGAAASGRNARASEDAAAVPTTAAASAVTSASSVLPVFGRMGSNRKAGAAAAAVGISAADGGSPMADASSGGVSRYSCDLQGMTGGVGGAEADQQEEEMEMSPATVPPPVTSLYPHASMLSSLNLSLLCKEIQALRWVGQGGGGAVFQVGACACVACSVCDNSSARAAAWFCPKYTWRVRLANHSPSSVARPLALSLAPQGVWQGASVAVKFLLAEADSPAALEAVALEGVVSSGGLVSQAGSQCGAKCGCWFCCCQPPCLASLALAAVPSVDMCSPDATHAPPFPTLLLCASPPRPLQLSITPMWCTRTRSSAPA
mgnify:CR=1 FL=1